MEVPVYLFAGFLESGKTQFISEVLDDPNFTQDERTVLLVCEEGVTEYDEEMLRRTNTVKIVIESAEGLTKPALAAIAAKYKPDRAMIEWNGMWPIASLQDILPDEWPLYQVVTTICGATWELYSANMGAQMLDHIANADLVVFNRSSEADKEKIRAKNIRAMNPRATIFFEDEDGNPEDYMDGMELPFDLDAPVIEVKNEDYGLWYIDAMNDPEKYEGKTVQVTGMVYKSDGFAPDTFVPGRFGMVCCAEDVTFIGFLCKTPAAAALKNEAWVTVTAEVHSEYYPQFRADGPVLYATAIQPAEKPEPDLVYFN
ncbi:TIGR03943 family putative permease subunit [Intestinibacillus massiliensis]|uniref:TIGR03943 family putative permease subunit n=1 Tax=Intestinibacillus massiliensis TaxID=1871029 RepID=UPI000B35FFDF|nr:TIGR03943 family protein [Intestinibacillus massiliensis]